MRTFFTSIFLLLFFLLTGSVAKGADKDIELIRQRIIAETLSSDVNTSRIKELIKTIREDGTWTGINYADTSKTAFEHGRHLENMVQLSRAFVKKGTGWTGNKEVKQTLYATLNYWLAHDFICENWWWNEIGTPNALIQVLLMMDKNLTKEQINKALPIIKRSNLQAQGARESGDRIKIGGIQAKTALFSYDTTQFNYVIQVIEGQIKFVTGRGMQYDYSFHHRDDRVNNTLSYGSDYANAFAEWAAYVAGTKYQFSEKPVHQLIDYFLDGICKMMPYGKYPDPGASNRDITRVGDLRSAGAITPERLLKVTDYRKDELEQIVKNRNGEEMKAKPFGKFFWDSEYYTHQRNGYFTSVRMFSSRNYNMEYPYNGEGLLNHYRGDGTNYLSRTGTEYYNTSPVYDWQKIPGTTILQKPLLEPEKEVQKQGTMDFVGAVADGLYGAVAFDFTSPHDPLRAKKAWFFFDTEYVCLGSGIYSETNAAVATTLNQCLLRGDVTVMSGDREQTLPQGERILDKVQWVFHDSIGYYFPEPAQINLSNRIASGSWFKINRQTDSPKEEVKIEMFKMWINHGSRVAGGKYQYVVVPAIGKEDLKKYAAKPSVEILSNTPEIQAVRHTGLNIIQLVFYKNGEILLPGDLKIQMDSPGILMLKTEGSGIKEISVADPSRKLGKIHLRVNRKIEKQGSNFNARWNSAENSSEITIDLPQTVYAGKSITIRLTTF